MFKATKRTRAFETAHRRRHDLAFLLFFTILAGTASLGLADTDFESVCVQLGVLLAATVATALSIRPRTRNSLRLLAATTFLLATTTFVWPVSRWRWGDTFIEFLGAFYLASLLLAPLYWFGFARWRKSARNRPPRAWTRSPARKPVSLGYGFAMWASVGVPIWAEVLAASGTGLGTFTALALFHSATLAAATAMLMAITLRKEKPLLLLAAVSLLASLAYQGIGFGGSLEISLPLATGLGLWWFLDRRWRPLLWHSHSSQAHWDSTETDPRLDAPVRELERLGVDDHLRRARRRARRASVFWLLIAAYVVALASGLLATNVPTLVLLAKSFTAEAEDGQAMIYLPIYHKLFASNLWKSYLLYLALTAPVLALAAWPAKAWKEPARVLLLRAFDRPRASRPLRQLVRQRLAGFGHIYTLADSNIRAPWYVLMPMLLGLVAFGTFGYREIRRPKDLERLTRAMRRRWLRSLNWILSRSKTFSVTTIDIAWESVVRRLLAEADVIAIDVSEQTPGVARELTICREMGLEGRMLLIFESGSERAVLPDLRSRALEYGRSKTDAAAIERRVAALLASSRQTSLPSGVPPAGS